MTEEQRVLDKIVKSVGAEVQVKYLALCNTCSAIFSIEDHFKKSPYLDNIECPECSKKA